MIKRKIRNYVENISIQDENLHTVINSVIKIHSNFDNFIKNKTNYNNVIIKSSYFNIEVQEWTSTVNYWINYETDETPEEIKKREKEKQIIEVKEYHQYLALKEKYEKDRNI